MIGVVRVARAQRIACAVAVLGCFTVLAASAEGRVGDIRFAGCLSASPDARGCTDVRSAGVPLSSPRPIAISPDGQSLYVGSDGLDAVSHFRRDLSGQSLSFADCVAGGAPPPPAGCASISPPTAPYDFPMEGPNAIAVSPDGRSVHVVSGLSDDLASFARDTATGALAFRGCLTDTSLTAGCSQALPLNQPPSVAISPDSRDVYTASYGYSTIGHYRRDAASGALTPADCVTASDSPSPLCTNIPGTNALESLVSIAITGDGKNLYAAARQWGTVSQFARDPGTGQLGFVRCITASINPGAAGCTDIRGTTDVLTGAGRLIVSPDDKSVYVSSGERDAIALFTRDPANGALAFRNCLSAGNGPARGCTEISATTDALDAVGAIAVSPEGSSVYAISGKNAITLFRRSRATGDLSFGGCVTAGSVTASGCVDITATTNALWLPQDVKVSPDGRNVYVTANFPNALASFSREPGVEDEGTKQRPPVIKDTVRPVLSRVSVRPRVFAVGPSTTESATVARRVARRTTFHYRLSEAARVELTFRRRLVRRRGSGCHKSRCVRFRAAGKLSLRSRAGTNRKRFAGRLKGRALRRGSYRVTLVAVDGAGNRSRARHVTIRVVRFPLPR
jgi:6-phosphogluconolactonase (cycloisomerase 2 family)